MPEDNNTPDSSQESGSQDQADQNVDFAADQTPTTPKTEIVTDEQTDVLPNVQYEGGTGHSVVASTEYTGFAPEHTYTPSLGHKTYERSDVAKAWQIGPNEKPSEIIKATGRINNDLETSDENKPNRSNLDEKDEYALRSNRANAEKKARRIRFIEHVKEYGEKLRNGRDLDDEEVNLVLENKLEQLNRYKAQKKYYEDKGLDKETIDYLLTTRDFKDDIEKILSSMKNSKGKYHSSKLDLDDVYFLHQTYKDFAQKEFVKDEAARLQERDTSQKEKEEGNYNQYVEEYNKENPEDKIATNKEDFLNQQEKDLLERERNAYQQAFRNQQGQTPEPQPEPEPEPEPQPEVDPDDDRRSRRRRTLALIGTTLAGAGVGLAVGPAGMVATTAISAVAIGGPILADKLAESRMMSLQQKIENAQNQEDREKFEKRFSRTRKFRDGVRKCRQYLTAFGFGILGGSFLNLAFLGGQGFVNKIAEAKQTQAAINGTSVGQQNPQGQSSTPNNTGQTPPIENMNPTITADTIPDRLNLDSSWSNFTKGLELRSGNDLAGKDLLLAGTKGGDGFSQRTVMEEFLRRGINPNTQEAGWAFGDLATKVRNGMSLTDQAINDSFARARDIIGNIN